ncbi:MAG: hypothetical protein AAF960_01120 [Bacteroidota bacterium]
MVSADANYKNIQNSYLISGLLSNGQGNSLLMYDRTILNAQREIGWYVGLDYLYLLDNAFSLGIHLSVENSSNILSKVGVSIGYNF